MSKPSKKILVVLALAAIFVVLHLHPSTRPQPPQIAHVMRTILVAFAAVTLVVVTFAVYMVGFKKLGRFFLMLFLAPMSFAFVAYMRCRTRLAPYGYVFLSWTDTNRRTEALSHLILNALKDNGIRVFDYRKNVGAKSEELIRSDLRAAIMRCDCSVEIQTAFTNLREWVDFERTILRSSGKKRVFVCLDFGYTEAEANAEQEQHIVRLDFWDGEPTVGLLRRNNEAHKYISKHLRSDRTGDEKLRTRYEEPAYSLKTSDAIYQNAYLFAATLRECLKTREWRPLQALRLALAN